MTKNEMNDEPRWVGVMGPSVNQFHPARGETRKRCSPGFTQDAMTRNTAVSVVMGKRIPENGV